MRTRSAPRRGVAAVELAVLLPLLMIMLLGLFEISRALQTRETLSNAAQQGCRTGANQGTTNADINEAVEAVMSNMGVSSYTVRVRVNDSAGDVSTARRFDKVSVQVTVPASQVFWVSRLFITGSSLESEAVVMMRQG